MTVPPPPKPDLTDGQPEGAPQSLRAPPLWPHAAQSGEPAGRARPRTPEAVGQQQEEGTDAGSGERPRPGGGGGSPSSGFISHARPAPASYSSPLLSCPADSRLSQGRKPVRQRRKTKPREGIPSTWGGRTYGLRAASLGGSDWQKPGRWEGSLWVLGGRSQRGPFPAQGVANGGRAGCLGPHEEGQLGLRQARTGRRGHREQVSGLGCRSESLESTSPGSSHPTPRLFLNRRDNQFPLASKTNTRAGSSVTCKFTFLKATTPTPQAGALTASHGLLRPSLHANT